MRTRRTPRRHTPVLTGARLCGALVLLLAPQAHSDTAPAAGGAGARAIPRTGIEFAWRTLRASPPSWWEVTDAVSGRRVVRVQLRWGSTPLPPGTYHVTAELNGVQGRARDVAVRGGALTPLTPGDLGLGQVMVELPSARGVVMIQGVSALVGQFLREGLSHPLTPETPGNPQVTLWAPEGPATVRFRGGAVVFDEPVTVVKGATRHVPFDAERLAGKLGLSAVSVVVRDAAGGVARRDTQVTLLDTRGEHLMALTPGPPAGATWLVPPGPVVRARLGGRELVRRDVPSGVGAEADLDFTPSRPGGPVKVQVDIKIESPPEGTVVGGDRTTVVGRASSSGPAGALRVALVVNVSNSATESCGADLDGDGREESIIQAEAAAGRVLLGELERVEEQTPGTAFEVTVVRFAAGAETLAPLTRMTDARGTAALRAALDRVAQEGSRGGTNYVAAFCEATRALQAAQRPGNTVILFMSDGGPNELRPSLDAAARAGLSQVVIHTFGLGREFLGKVDPVATFPPEPANPVNVLATVAALGAPVGTVTALPRPADVVQVVPRLPVLELPEARLKEVRVVNATTGVAASSVRLERDGAFQAEVPVGLLPTGLYESNALVATATARDGVSEASDRVNVRCPPQPGTLAVVYRPAAGDPPLPPGLMPAVELILDSSGSMRKPVGGTAKYLVARRVLHEVLGGLPDGVYVGLRLYGHLGFLPHRPSRPPPTPDPEDPRLRTDSQLVVAIGRLDAANRREIRRAIDDAWPRGDTPLCYALLQSLNDFPQVWRGPRLVVLVSDGEENCGGNVSDVARAFRDRGIGVTVHVVGFDIRGVAAKQQLEEVARAGGGRYFDARDARGLADALRQAVSLAGFDVLDANGRAQAAQGRVNGPPVSLMPGRYRVRLHRGTEMSPVLRLRDRQRVEVSVTTLGGLEVPPDRQ